MSLWARLPGHGCRAPCPPGRAAADRAGAGVVFSPAGGWQDYLRVNAVQADDERFFAFLEEACRKA
jgi:hypothetical protein